MADNKSRSNGARLGNPFLKNSVQGRITGIILHKHTNDHPHSAQVIKGGTPSLCNTSLL